MNKTMIAIAMGVFAVLSIAENSAHAREPGLRDTDPKEFSVINIPVRERQQADWQNTHKQRVSVSLPVSDYMQAFEAAPAHEFESREYSKQVSGEVLQQGITLKTTAPGTVIRISGLDAMGKAKNIEPELLQIRVGKGSARNVKQASAQMQKSQGEHDTVMSPGSLAFKLQNDAGYGALQLSAAKSLDRNATYQVQVYEPNSRFTLKAGLPQDTVLAGSMLHANASMADLSAQQKSTVTPDWQNYSAVLLAPDGRRIPLNAMQKGGALSIQEMMEHSFAYAPGLWEVEWKANALIDGIEVERHIRTAFAYGAKSAEWQHNMNFRQKARSSWLFIDVPVTVHQAGRFELRATASQKINGDLYPVQFLSTAQWLEPGQRTITLQLNRRQLKQSGVRADLQLQDVQLLDQTQMIALQKRPLAQVISQRLVR